MLAGMNFPRDFVATDFRRSAKNTSNKAIASLTLASEMFPAPRDLRQPHIAPWTSNQPIAPGAQQTVEKPWVHSRGTQAVIGWVFFPTSIQYQDGSTWHPESEGECFNVIGRDPEHPHVPALPPRQIEINAD